jgi:hypothetical protein
MSDHELVITAAGEWQHGKKLRAIWGAISLLDNDNDDGPAALVLISDAATVTTFLAEVGGGGIRVCGDPKDVLVAVCGSWPYARTCELVLAFNTLESHPKMWARTALRKVLHDPQRQIPEALEEGLVQKLIEEFQSAKLRSETDG